MQMKFQNSQKITKPIEIANFIYELASEKTFISNRVLSISGGE